VQQVAYVHDCKAETGFLRLFDFGIINASGGSGEVRLALVAVKAGNYKARLEKILYIAFIKFSLHLDFFL
jgi:hypothetical protein